MRSKVTDLNSRVPGTKYTAREVCRVKRTKKPLKRGSLLAYEGAYDNKYVVASVKLIKKNSTWHYSNGLSFTSAELSGWDVYEVVTRRLGKFFADGRLEPSPTYNQHKTSTHTANVPTGEKLVDIRGTRFRHVEPSNKPILPLNPCNSMNPLEMHMLHLARMSYDPYNPKIIKVTQSKQIPIREPAQQRLIDEVKNRTYRGIWDYPSWMIDEAKDNLKKQAEDAAAWKAKNLATNTFTLPPPVPQDPEAVLAMFRL